MKYFFICFFNLISLYIVSTDLDEKFADEIKNENVFDNTNSKIYENIKTINGEGTRNKKYENLKKTEAEGESYKKTISSVHVDEQNKIKIVNKKPIEKVTESPNSTDNENLTTTQIPNNDTHKSRSPKFEQPLYIIELQKNNLKDVGFEVPFKISFKDKYNEDIKFFLDRIDSGIPLCLNVSHNKKEIKITLEKGINETDLQKFTQFLFVLKITKPDSQNVLAETVLIMNLLNYDPSKPKKLKFLKSNYEIKTLVEHIGILQRFSAILENSGDEMIEYNICSNDVAFLNNYLEINKNSGILSNYKHLEANLYKIKICAETSDKKYTAETEVSLIVEHVVVCDSKQINFAYSLFIARIPEGQPADNVVKPANALENCFYDISSQNPQGDYFNLDKNTGSLSLKTGVYKNDTIFKKMRVPKFIVKLKVTCKKINKRSINEINKNNQTSSDEEETIDDYFNIQYDPTSMTVFIIIQENNSKFLNDVIVDQPKQIKKYFLFNVVIILLIFLIILVVAGFYFKFIKKNPIPLWLMSRNRNGSAATPLEDNAEGPSQTRWINSRINMFNNYDNMGEESSKNCYINSSENHTVSFSNNTGELVLIDGKNYSGCNNSLSAGVSTFKPNNENDHQNSIKYLNNERINTKYSDIDTTIFDSKRNSSSDMAKNDVPILQVISLPPPAAMKKRNRNRISNHTDDLKINA